MPEVDAQTVRDATEARIEAEQAQETAQQAQWDAESARAANEDLVRRMGELEERVIDTEAVTLGIVSYLAEEEAAQDESEHTEVEHRSGSKPEDRAPEPEQQQDQDDRRHAGSLF